MPRELQTVQYAYVDESGDPSLDLSKDGVSKFYVVAAILADSVRKDELVRNVDSIRARHFGPGEIKSSGVGGNLARRRNIVSDLVGSGIKFCALVADKSQIDPSSGLQYRRSFIKYLHGRLYKRLYRAFSSLHVLADEHGRSEFMEGFKQYLEARYHNELFDHEDFTFVPSEQNPLVQAADFIAGTIFRVYSGSDPLDLLALLANSAIIVERWPPAGDQADIVTGLPDQERFNHLVSQQGVMLARSFIHDNADTDDPELESQVEALRYLLYRYELDPSEYVHADPILRHVNMNRDDDLSIQSFRTSIIARLRSDGVIIASSNKGYKIPNTTSDISDFVSLVEGLTLPYLKRLLMARHHLLLSSQREYEIVPESTYPQLAACLRSIDGNRFEPAPPVQPRSGAH